MGKALQVPEGLAGRGGDHVRGSATPSQRNDLDLLRPGVRSPPKSPWPRNGVAGHGAAPKESRAGVTRGRLSCLSFPLGGESHLSHRTLSSRLGRVEGCSVGLGTAATLVEGRENRERAE